MINEGLNKPEGKLVILTEEQIAEMVTSAAKIGAEAAMERLESEKQKVHKKAVDKRLHNTRLLLKNYRMLKAHAMNSVFGRTQMQESAADVLESMMNLYNDEIIVDSIKRSASRTAIIISHIDNMLGIYSAYCDKSKDRLERRRYNTIHEMWISADQKTVKEIAKAHHISAESVYVDINIAIERLSALIFGVDGLKSR